MATSGIATKEVINAATAVIHQVIVWTVVFVHMQRRTRCWKLGGTGSGWGACCIVTREFFLFLLDGSGILNGRVDVHAWDARSRSYKRVSKRLSIILAIKCMRFFLLFFASRRADYNVVV